MSPGRDVVAVAASAGGLQPLRALLRDLPAAVFAVLHVPATGGRTLPYILGRAGPLPAATAHDGERIRPGRVYVAPPDRHLLAVRDAVRLSRGPRQNGVRPAADPLFRSAALSAGPRVTAVVLSGALDDADGFLGTVLRSLGNAVIVLNEDLKVRVWSPGAEDLWGLRPEEAEDKELFSLDIGLPAVAVEPMLRRVLREAANDDTATALTGDVTAVNRRGKTVELQIVASPMRTEEGGISGVILVIDQRSP